MRLSWVGWTVGLALLAATSGTPTSRAWGRPNRAAVRRSVDEATRFEVSSQLELVKPEPPSNAPRSFPLPWHPIVRHATEPSALVLLGTGLLGIATLLRKRQRPR